MSAGAADTGPAGTPGDFTAITNPLLSSIAEEEARNGPFSPNLVEMLTSLGLTYQEFDEHTLAVTVLERALYLKRVNDGLFGLDQVPLVRRLIASEREIGREATAVELEERLLELARRNPRDARSASIFSDAAEREVDFYERYLRGEVRPPALTFGMNIDPVGDSARGSIRQARRLYNEAIGALARGGGDRAEVAELQEIITRTYYLEAEDRHRYFVGVDDPLYGRGEASHQRLLDYATGAVDSARALVALADWSLLFSRNGTAVKRYAEAYAVLVESQAPTASIDELFPKATPVFLPAFEPPPIASPGAGSTGYVDVDFEVGKYGQPRKVTLVDSEGPAADALSKDVVAAIERGRFRPSPMVDGAVAYHVRYSLADGSLRPRL